MIGPQGSLNAMAVFESNYKSNMTKEEAMQLVHDAVLSGINNDLGSGSNVDMMVITKDGAEPHRNYSRPNDRKFRKAGGFKFPRGTTKVVS